MEPDNKVEKKERSLNHIMIRTVRQRKLKTRKCRKLLAENMQLKLNKILNLHVTLPDELNNSENVCYYESYLSCDDLDKAQKEMRELMVEMEDKRKLVQVLRACDNQ